MRKTPTFLPYLLIAPTLAFVVAFTLLPLGSSLVESFFRHQLNIPKFQTPQFAGFRNYAALLGDPGFRGILLNTVVYVVVLVPASVLAALGLSLLVWGLW